MHRGDLPCKAAFAAAVTRAITAPSMSDSAALCLIALVAAGLVALALVWPQGLGSPSLPPFGHALAPLPTVAAKLPGAKQAATPAALRPAIR
jgi:hypothetical protein